MALRRYQNETTPILAYYDHQSLVHKIDGTRDVDAVWADTQAAISTIEGRLASTATGDAVSVHIYCSGDEAMAATELYSRVAEAATQRFGEGAVALEGRPFQVGASLKAFELKAAPAFD